MLFGLIATACESDTEEDSTETTGSTQDQTTVTVADDSGNTPESEATASDAAETVVRTETTSTSDSTPTADMTPTETAPEPTPTEEVATATATEVASTATPTVVPTEVAAPAAEPIQLSGSGQTLTDPVQIQEGILVATGTHSGERNFIVNLISSTTGENAGLLSNTIGTVGSTTATLVRESGEYVIDVMADGDWTLELLQPTPASSDITETPWELSGTGDQVFYFLNLEQGVHRATASHTGTSNFFVWAFPTQGSFVYEQLVFNEVGVVIDVSAAVQVTEGGPYLIAISADGDWTVRIE